MKCIKGAENLQPRAVWENFDKILSIPHPSGHEEQLVRYLAQFSERFGLEFEADDLGNTIIRKKAANGKENSPGIVLQAHLDMVPQKNKDKKHDFLKDPIKAYVDGDWIKTYGTTLGADNGVGAAMIMTVLQSDDIIHGPVEALFTVQEEIGLHGASQLKPGLLKGKYLLNLDCGGEGIFSVGCAGGINTEVFFHYKPDKIKKSSVLMNVSLKGLKGGHSGADAHLQRGNANKILFRLLNDLRNECNFRITDINAGGLRNAIPREAEATLAIEAENISTVKDSLNNSFRIIKDELGKIEPDMVLNIHENSGNSDSIEVIDVETQEKLISSVHACPNGVIRKSDDIPDLVETSSNLASVKLDKESQTIKLLLMQRSSVDTQKESFCSSLKALFQLAGAELRFSGSYPGWKPNLESGLLKTAKKVHSRINNKEPLIEAVHAGLECGIIGSLYPEMEMIAFGPDIIDNHSPDERVNHKSVARFWKFLVAFLEEL